MLFCKVTCHITNVNGFLKFYFLNNCLLVVKLEAEKLTTCNAVEKGTQEVAHLCQGACIVIQHSSPNLLLSFCCTSLKLPLAWGREKNVQHAQWSTSRYHQNLQGYFHLTSSTINNWQVFVYRSVHFGLKLFVFFLWLLCSLPWDIWLNLHGWPDQNLCTLSEPYGVSM